MGCWISNLSQSLLTLIVPTVSVITVLEASIDDGGGGDTAVAAFLEEGGGGWEEGGGG